MRSSQLIVFRSKDIPQNAQLIWLINHQQINLAYNHKIDNKNIFLKTDQ